MAKKSKKSKRRKKPLSERQKLLKSINRSIKYREKLGYIVNPEFKEKLQRKQTKTLKSIKENVGFEIAQHSTYIDPFTNKTMTGKEARAYRRKTYKKRKEIESRQKALKEAEYDFYQDVDSDTTFNMYTDSDVVSIIDWLQSEIMMLPNVKYFGRGVNREYSGYKQTLLSYISDRLSDATVERYTQYANYIKQHENEIVTCFEKITHSSKQENIEGSYRSLFDILKGGPLTFEEAQEAESLNEYYEDFEEDF